MQKIKLVCMDLDGTLLNDKKEISEQNRRVIREAVSKNVKVVVSTGRFYTMASYFANQLELTTPVISSNGAFVKRFNDDEIISKTLLGYENAIAIYEILQHYKLNPFFNDHETIYYDEENTVMRFNKKINGSLEKMGKTQLQLVKDWHEVFTNQNDRLLKCLVVNNQDEQMNKAKEALKQLPDVEVVSSLSNSFEVMKKGVSKGRAVKIIAEQNDIKQEEIMCIGDGENDLSMIQYAGIGVAMENGLDILKENADYVTISNNDHGLAHAFEKFVL